MTYLKIQQKALNEMSLFELVSRIMAWRGGTSNDPEAEEELRRRQRMLDAAEGMAKAIEIAAAANVFSRRLAEAWSAYESAKGER